MGRKPKNNDSIIIPNKLFNLLWTASTKYSSISDYTNSFISIKSDDYIDYNKYDFDIIGFKSFLEKIYQYSHISFKELLEATGYGISEFAYAFCIPLQTVKTWASPKGSFASYNLLTYLRYFGLLDFGNIMIEEELKRYNTSAKKYGERVRDVAKMLKYFDDSDKLDIFNDKEHISRASLVNNKTHSQETQVPTSPVISSPLKRGPLHGLSTEESIEILSNRKK